MDLYTCDSCGGKFTIGQNNASVTCPYCDGQLVVSGRLSGKRRPDYIIPFETNYNDAVSALKNTLPKINLYRGRSEENPTPLKYAVSICRILYSAVR